MTITWLGAICFPLGAFLFFVVPRWIYAITIFCIPFTATSLLNMASGVPLSPLQFFGSLFIAQQTLMLMARGRTKFFLRGDRSLLFLLLFLAVVLLSMIMPAVIDGKLWVTSGRIFDLYDTPLRLTENTIKYPLPVIFGVVLATFLVLRNDSPEKIVSSVRIYVMGGIFVALWGYLQFLCDNVLGTEYPYYVFNNALLETTQGYLQNIEIGEERYSRLASVTHEPSIFAKYLLTAISIMLFPVLTKQPLLGRLYDRVALVLLIGVLLLATSATGYAGFAFALLTTGAVIRRLGGRGVGWTTWSWGGLGYGH